MKPKEILWVLFLAIAALILNGKPTWSQSVGGTQSERSGGDSQTPLPKGSPSAGSTDPSKTEKGSVGSSKSGAKDTSVGGSQSERSGGDSQTPLPKGSRSAGSADPSKAGASKSPTGTAQGTKDTSVGGTQSERSGGDSQTPLPKGSRSAGSEDAMKARQGTASGHQGMGGAQDVRQAQEALKNQGHDPGPIDGVLGSQTRQALRAFQSKNGLKQTGVLDAETKQKLNMESSSPSPMSK